MHESMDFWKVLSSSHKFKESLREKLQVNIDSIRKVLVMYGFFDVHHLVIVLSQIIGVLTLLVKLFSKSDFNIDNINKTGTNFSFDNVIQLPSFHLFSIKTNIMEMLKSFDNLIISSTRSTNKLNLFLYWF